MYVHNDVMNVFSDVVTAKDVNEHGTQVHVAAAAGKCGIFCRHGTRHVHSFHLFTVSRLSIQYVSKQYDISRGC